MASKSATITVKDASAQLNLSRVRILGLWKAGKLTGKKDFVSGTTIPQVLLDRKSVESYVPSRSTGQRSMIVSLPSAALDELYELCNQRGWSVKAKNSPKNYSNNVELDETDEDELEAEAA